MQQGVVQFIQFFLAKINIFGFSLLILVEKLVYIFLKEKSKMFSAFKKFKTQREVVII